MMPFRSLVVLLALTFAAVALQAAKPAMATRTFKVPPDFLSCDTPATASPAPPATPVDPFDPARAATPGEGAAPPQPRAARKILEGIGVTFPDGATAGFDPFTSTLTVTNTQENLELTAAFMTELERQAPANVAFSLTVIEGPGELIRAANAAASKSANAAPALATLLDQARKAGSEVHVVGDGFLETKSGTRATLEAVLEHRHATEFLLDAKSQASILQEMRQAGLILEIEPVVGGDRTTVEITYALKLHPAPPVQRQVSVNDPFSGHLAEFPVTDVPGAELVAGITTMAGHTKLLGVMKPPGTPKADSDTLWAVFLTTTLRRVEALPLPQAKVAAPSALPPGMVFAALPAPEGLFTGVLSGPKNTTLQSWLTGEGIAFPAGASIEQKEGLLHVINTQDNIGLIATVVDREMANCPKTLAWTLHTVEAPAALLRDLTRQTLATADDGTMFATVEAAAARGEARFINSAFVETKSGTRAVHDAGREHRYVDSFRTDEKGRPVASFETRVVGSHIEIEPALGMDNRTVELMFSHELHPTAPVLRHDKFRDPASQQPFEMPATDFHVHKTTTGVSVSKGSTKLISLNPPTGREHAGVLWATFLKCDVVPQVGKPQAQPKADAAKDPRAYLNEKLNRIILPSVAFRDTPIDEAIDHLRVKSRELDANAGDSSLKGFRIVVRYGDVPSEARITLDLKDVTMAEALREVTEQAQMTYKVEAHAVVIYPLREAADTMFTRSYRVPPDFLAIGGYATYPGAAPPAPANSFSDATPSGGRGLISRKSAKQILEAQGISFPEGASASTTNGMLMVRNTQPNLDLVEAFLDSMCITHPKTIAFTTHVLQGPGSLLRRLTAQAATKSDHRAELDELLAAVKTGTVQHLDTARIETKSGIHSTTEQGMKHTAITAVSVNEKGVPLITQERRHVGLRVELEPTIGADGVTVELRVAPEFHTAPPFEHRQHLIDTQGRRHEFPLTDYHMAKASTGITLPDGTVRLLSLHKPSGKPEFEKEDVLQVMFITCDILSPW